jgi:23S rRNA (uridine2552-2'-O)-methyltransferase
MAKRTKSSQLWLERQRRDPYVKKAAAGGLGSRAHFKLAQLDERFALLRPSMAVLELGSAPGGWTKYLAGRVHDGRIVAVDYRPMPVPRGVVFLCLDIYSEQFEPAVDVALEERKLDLVLSDMSPNISGVKAADQAAAMDLIELATASAMRWLKPTGALVVKMFQGEGTDAWIKDMRRCFAKVTLAKPAASRAESREVYGIATGFTGAPACEVPLGGRTL